MPEDRIAAAPGTGASMKERLRGGVLMLPCAAMAGAIGGGLYEHIVLIPLWSASPPSSFSVIQPDTGVPQQRFWIPVHTAITTLLLAALFAIWKERKARRFILIGLACYAVMRVWSAVFFIPEMLAFQRVPLDSVPTPELMARVASWTFWTWFREPLDIAVFACFLLALFWVKKPGAGAFGEAPRP